MNYENMTIENLEKERIKITNVINNKKEMLNYTPAYFREKYHENKINNKYKCLACSKIMTKSNLKNHISGTCQKNIINKKPIEFEKVF